MSMYRREHAGFDYELWLRRGHTGTPDDFLEWLRGPQGEKGEKGDPAGADSITEDMLTTGARAALMNGYLPIANERHYGSAVWPSAQNVQGMCSYERDNTQYVVFATQYESETINRTHMYLYNYTSDILTLYAVTQEDDGAHLGHYNDMAYCPLDGKIYVANYTEARIEVFDTAGDKLEWSRAIDMSGFGKVHSIAWSDKEECFYVDFISHSGATNGLFRFDREFNNYTINTEFKTGGYSRQCLHIERSTGNIMELKFRTANTFSDPPGNRIQISSPEGRLIAVTQLNAPYEVEGLCELSDGNFFIVYAGKAWVETAAGGSYKRAALFTTAAIRDGQTPLSYSTYNKYYINTSDYTNRSDGVYYQEKVFGTESGYTNKVFEDGTALKPFKCWPGIYNMIYGNGTDTLTIHLNSNMTWPLELAFFPKNLSFVGESALWEIPRINLYRCAGSVAFENINAGTYSLVLNYNKAVYFKLCTVSAVNEVQWPDNDLISIMGCDVTGIGVVDLLRTRVLVIGRYEYKNNVTPPVPMVYGTATRFHGVGVSYRIYGDTTTEEQYVLRGQTCSARYITGVALTAISQVRMNLTLSVGSAASANYTDLPEDVKGLSFTARAEVLNDDRMLYRLERDGITRQRVVRFGALSEADQRTLKIVSDSGWSEPIGDNTIKILGIGNSHTRDALKYVYEILSRAGYNVVVGHFFWGGSSLAMQYNALINNVWPAVNPQTGISNEYYRKYDASGLLKYHRHGDDHNHKLDYALTDEKWDVVIFQNSSPHSIDYDNFFDYDNAFGYTHDGKPLAFTINKFIDEVKTRIGNPNLKIGIAPPPPRPYDYVEDTGVYNPDTNPLGGVTTMVGLLPAETAQMTEDVLYRVANDMSQCDFVINTAKGILLARGNEHLDALGHDMMREVATPNEHLSAGVPFFLSAMMYAITICGDEVAYGMWYPDPGDYDPEDAKYSVGNVMLYDGKVYRCVTAPPYPAGDFDSQYWEEYNLAELAFLAKRYAKRAVLFHPDTEEKVAVKSSGLYLRPGLMHGYSDANDLPANQIFEVFSNVTATNLANLPAYGEIAYIMTLTYDAASAYSMQIYMGTSTFATRIKAANGWRAWTIYAQQGV